MQKAGKHPNTQTAQGNSNAKQEQNRLTGDSSRYSGYPTDSSGKDISHSSKQSRHLKFILSFCRFELASGTQETGKHAHTKTAQGNGNAEEQQDGIIKRNSTAFRRGETGNTTGHSANHGHSRCKYLADSSEKVTHTLHLPPHKILINFAMKQKHTKLKR